MYTHSDHLAISVEVRSTPRFQLTKPGKKAQQKAWKVKMIDTAMMHYIVGCMEVPSGCAERKSKLLMKALENVCDASMPRRGKCNGRAPLYWWNEEISDLRHQCHCARRLHQRNRQSEQAEELWQDYRSKRATLRKAISRSKSIAFKELIADTDNNPWGNAYKVAMRKMRAYAGSAPTCPITMKQIVTELFPSKGELVITRELSAEPNEIPEITDAEVIAAARSIKAQKAPGLDGIPNLVIKEAIKAKPEVFRAIYNECLQEGVFPKSWKRQRLVLIPKAGIPGNTAPSYRPLCLLDTTGKILEKIICTRLQPYTESAIGLSKCQYGFRPKKSTLGAISKVCNIARDAIQGDRWLGGTKQYCAIITLDIKNAFNTANWCRILNALHNLIVPQYILKIIVSYFRERTLIYDTDAGPITYNVTGGVPQGSVLGPLLWNVMYDGVLRLTKPEGVQVVGYADDIAIVVVAKTIREVAANSNEMIGTIKEWLQEHDLQLAEHKTEMVLVSSRKKVERMSIMVGGHTIESRAHIRYLGVSIDHRLCFKEHIKQMSYKASRVCNLLARIMPNIGGPNQQSRLLLTSVSKSILMYAAPVWAGAVQNKSYIKELKSVYRLANLRVCRAYRTVSEEAACVLAGRLPIDLEIQAAAKVYLHSQRNAGITSSDREVIMQAISAEWQHRWDNALNARWTHYLIPVISIWNNREYGELNFYLTQFFTGHGCFRKYLHRFKHVDNPYCLFCDGRVEDAEHVVSECQRFVRQRRALELEFSCRASASQLVNEMLSSAEKWAIGSHFLKDIMLRLRQDDNAARSIEE